MKKRKLLLGIGIGVLLLIALGFPLKTKCANNSLCGGSYVTYPADGHCYSVINRPAIAYIINVNWYYEFYDVCS